jgi:hypothetical protein
MAKLNPEISVLVQAAPPPAATAPAVPTPPALQRLAPISQKARPLVLTKGGRTENAVVRHQIFLRTVVKPGPAPVAVEGVTVSAIPCAWTVETFLQREICFYSMTGLMACTDTNTLPLMATETGQTDLPVGTACEVFAKPVEAAESRVIAAVDRTKDQLYDEDYKLVVKPQLVRGGTTVTER